jgi:signal peptidase I
VTTEPAAEPVPARKRAIALALKLGVLVLAFLVVHGLLLEVFVVSGASMEPTLHEHDRLLVWKATRTFARGELVVFTHPMEDERVLVKRVIGLPGERIEVRNGKVYADGRELGEPWIERDRDRAPFLQSAPETVPAGSYFVMGDNRAHSKDSRAFGPLEGSRIIGRALFVIWPPRRVN